MGLDALVWGEIEFPGGKSIDHYIIIGNISLQRVQQNEACFGNGKAVGVTGSTKHDS